jgi:tetratricopeptide (TPR) repeat protein
MTTLIRLALLIPLTGLLLVLAGLAFAWSTGGTDGYGAADPRLIHPSRELRLLIGSLQRVGVDAAPELLDDAKRALAAAPLEEEPFIVAALVEQKEGRYEEAVRLLDIARRRSARSYEARFLAVDSNMAAGNIATAVKDLEALLRLAREQRPLTQETLVLLAGHPETGGPALAAIEEDSTKVMVLTGLARALASPPDLLEAIRVTRASEAVRDNPGAVNAITRPLIDAGDYPAAYRVWSELVGEKSRGDGFVGDPEFAGTIPPPFGWAVRSGSDGYAILASPGLAGEAYGRRAAQLASQVLVLPAGAYRLEVDIRDASEALEARMQCLKGEEVFRARLDEAGALKRRFSIPADCAAQSLELRARASDPPRADGFSIRSITIARAGA